MNKENKIIIIFYVFLAVSFVSVIIYFDSILINKDILDIIPLPIDYLEYEKIVNVEQKKIYEVMSDVTNYPLVLPKNVLDINIIEQGDNYVIAEETISEQGVKTTLLVRHTFTPYTQHSIRILDGDAKDTFIITKFEPVGNSTKINTSVNLKLDGLLKAFSYIPKRSLTHALATTISSFEQYAQGFNSEYEKMVDDLYRKILLRPADKPALLHYAPLLEQETLTQSQLEKILKDSLERKILTESYDELISELNSTTKATIDEIYLEQLKRSADQLGLAYYGTKLENNEMTIDDIKATLFESEEGFYARVDSGAKRSVEDSFQEIFSRHATIDELDYYSSMIISKNMTKEDVREELLDLKTSGENKTKLIDQTMK